MKDLDLYTWVALGFVIVGGITLGLYGVFHFNLLEAILGDLLGRLLSAAVGGAAGYLGYQIYLTKFKKA